MPLLLHILVSVFQELLGLAVVLPHYQLFAQINDLLHKRLEYIEKLARVGDYLTVEALLELVNAVVGVFGVFVERYPLKIVDIILSIYRPVYHRPLHKVVRVKISVMISRCAVNIAGLARVLRSHRTRERYLLAVLLNIAHKQTAVLLTQTVYHLDKILL